MKKFSPPEASPSSCPPTPILPEGLGIWPVDVKSTLGYQALFPNPVGHPEQEYGPGPLPHPKASLRMRISPLAEKGHQGQAGDREEFSWWRRSGMEPPDRGREKKRKRGSEPEVFSSGVASPLPSPRGVPRPRAAPARAGPLSCLGGRILGARNPKPVVGAAAPDPRPPRSFRARSRIPRS